MILATLSILVLLWLRHVLAEGFTFPTSSTFQFIVGDVINITWDVVTPRLSLYEVCSEVATIESNVSNTYSYLWTANRDIYRESGCVFQLEPRGVNGVPSPPNVTSPLFGVAKRYSDDPQPVLYNGYDPISDPSQTVSKITVTSTTSSPTTSSTPGGAHSSTEQLSSTTPGLSSNSITPQQTPTSSTASPSPSPMSEQTGLTGAAKIGIGVGVPACAILVVGGMVFKIVRRRRRKKKVSPPRSPQQQSASCLGAVKMDSRSPFHCAVGRHPTHEMSVSPTSGGGDSVHGHHHMDIEDPEKWGHNELQGIPKSELHGVSRSELPG